MIMTYEFVIYLLCRFFAVFIWVKGAALSMDVVVGVPFLSIVMSYDVALHIHDSERSHHAQW